MMVMVPFPPVLILVRLTTAFPDRPGPWGDETAGPHANSPTGCRTGLAGRFRIRRLTSLSVSPSSTSGLTTANGYSTPSFLPARRKKQVKKIVAGPRKERNKKMAARPRSRPVCRTATTAGPVQWLSRAGACTHARVLIARRSAAPTPPTCHRGAGRGGRRAAVVITAACSCLLQWWPGSSGGRRGGEGRRGPRRRCRAPAPLPARCGALPCKDSVAPFSSYLTHIQ
uniref:Predicted protein n=1 Tax=Hordeum vulgare subsp. vulgare TaxID=112509 RepID=F2EFX2_HORVV|nr:predicted protein [Hordeum vulgare subsp. vulgare]